MKRLKIFFIFFSLAAAIILTGCGNSDNSAQNANSKKVNENNVSANTASEKNKGKENNDGTKDKTGASNASAGRSNSIEKSSSVGKNITKNNNKVVPIEKALTIAKEKFGKEYKYVYLKKSKINGREYYLFRWGDAEGESDSRACIDIKSGKAYLLYVDGKFVDYDAYIKNAKK